VAVQVMCRHVILCIYIYYVYACVCIYISQYGTSQIGLEPIGHHEVNRLRGGERGRREGGGGGREG
jgi:hypothetical protein